jgi:hypothetical protein
VGTVVPVNVPLVTTTRSEPPEPDAAPEPPEDAPEKRRNWWIWLSAGSAIVVVGLLIWALTLRSDVDSAQAETQAASQELETTNEQLEATQAELNSTKQELDTTTQQLDDATQPATPPPAASEGEESEGGTAGSSRRGRW